MLRNPLLLALTFAFSVVAAAPIERIAARKIQIGLDSSSGQLVEFVDRETQFNLTERSTNAPGIWELAFANSTRRLNPTDAASFSTSRRKSEIEFTWRDFNLPDAPKLEVTVSARLDTREPMSRWRIRIRNLGVLTLDTIRFPRVVNVARQSGERLAVPVWVGQETENPRARLRGTDGTPKRFGWHYPGIFSMQCLALANDANGGLYLACDDADSFSKDFEVFASADADLNFEIAHRPERTAIPRTDYALPYSVVLGTFQGNWFSAAQIYRAWATNQSWTHQSRLARGMIPSWATNTAMWVWNRGASPGAIDPAIELQSRLNLPVSVFWHWWHGCAYDAGFPEYFPPREGETNFIAALQRAHEHDVHAIVYMNQRLWGMTTASWTNENAERFAVKNSAGKVQPEVYNTFTKQPCASMCMGTEFWRNKYATLATKAFRELNVDGIYMDQACSSLACFDPLHGHTIGGGTYWMRGFQSLAADIRSRCAARGTPALAGEGCGENWLPHLDLMLALQVSRERYTGDDGWQTIPFFQAVYHQHAVFFGNYSSLTEPPYDELWPAKFAPREPLKLLDRKFSPQFRLEQARAFVWGQQPTIANFRASHLTERDSEIQFALRLAKVRHRAVKYLLNGELLPPLKITAPSARIPMSRLSIYAGQLTGVKEFRADVPLIHAAAWRARDGGVAIAIANIGEHKLSPTLEIDARECKLPRRGQVFRIDENGRRKIGEFRGSTVVLKPEMAEFDACLLELKRD